MGKDASNIMNETLPYERYKTRKWTACHTAYTAVTYPSTEDIDHTGNMRCTQKTTDILVFAHTTHIC